MKYQKLHKWFWDQAKVIPPRSMVRWAVEEIILPTGQKKGENLSFDYAPFTRKLVEEYERGDYRRFWLSGSVQSGKTLFGFCVPTLYFLCEMREDVICLLPTMELASAVWGDKLYPVFRSNPRLSKLLPKSGAGSRGGHVDAIRLTNGATLRFMAAGGSDAQRSSHTARIIVITEADKVDEATGSSKETDPVTQAESRTTSFGDKALLFAECTVSHEKGRVWRETQEIGTGTRVFIKCPHCNQYIYPERARVVGWQEAESIGEAGENVAYACQSCDAMWAEQDRCKANEDPLLVHKTQTIEDGKVIGDAPKTNTFGLLYNIIHSPLVTLSFIGEQMWVKNQDGSRDSKRYIHQFLFAEPYASEEGVSIATTPRKRLLEHTSEFEQGVIPPDIDFTIASLDIQKSWCYLTVTGFKWDMTSHLIHAQVVDIVPRDKQEEVKMPTPAEVVTALDSARSIANRFSPKSFWVDLGYKHEASTQPLIRQWIIAQGAGVNAVMGRAETMMGRMGGDAVKVKLAGIEKDVIQPRRQSDGLVIWFVNVDAVKDLSYAALAKPVGTAGCAYIFNGIEKPESAWIIRHLTSEQRVIQLDKRGIEQRRWVNPAGKRNDLWDCLQYCRAGAMVHIATTPPKARKGAKPKVIVNDEQTKSKTKKQRSRRRPNVPRPNRSIVGI